MASLAALEKLLEGPRDGALLRHAIGLVHLQEGRPEAAANSFRQALECDPAFSAAWKMLGKALTAAGDAVGAAEAFTQGIEVAESRGDVQAAKEMKVFLRRLKSG